jgi:phosphate acyltransferase
MGSVFSAHVLGYNNPSVALMSIGEEDMRGNDVTKEAFKLLKASGLNFRGNIEGHDLFERPAEDVPINRAQLANESIKGQGQDARTFDHPGRLPRNEKPPPFIWGGIARLLSTSEIDLESLCGSESF